MLHGLCCGEEAGARNLVFFREKWLQVTMKGTSSVRRLRLGLFRSFPVGPMLGLFAYICGKPCFLMSVGII